MRTISSTIIGQIFDTGLFVFIAFLGMFPIFTLFAIAISNYIFKVLIEALMTPVTYKVVGYLKKSDEIDAFDSGISYNPFSIK